MPVCRSAMIVENGYIAPATIDKRIIANQKRDYLAAFNLDFHFASILAGDRNIEFFDHGLRRDLLMRLVRLRNFHLLTIPSYRDEASHQASGLTSRVAVASGQCIA